MGIQTDGTKLRDGRVTAIKRAITVSVNETWAYVNDRFISTSLSFYEVTTVADERLFHCKTRNPGWKQLGRVGQENSVIPNEQHFGFCVP